MIKSNQAALPITAFKGKTGVDETIANNFETLDLQKQRRQVSQMSRSRMNGDADGASAAASSLRLNQSTKPKPIKPLIRNKTAREFG